MRPQASRPVLALRALLVPVALLVVLDTSAAAARPSNKWRIQVSGNAESDGTLLFYLVPEGGDPRPLEVEVFAGTSENGVAKTIALDLAGEIGGTHEVEVDDGEDVLVKRRRGQPDFDLELASSTVRGVRIRLDRE